MRFDKSTQFCMSLSARPSDFGIRFHNSLYEQMGLNFLYKSFAVSSPAGFEDAVRAICALGIRGCGISMPFKETALKYADEVDPSARRIGAINTLVNENGRLIGHNTDYMAVHELLKRAALPTAPSAVLLGSGGMARAIACALSDLGFSNAFVVSRTEATGRRIEQDFGLRWLGEMPSQPMELLINATPIGMAPHDRESDPLAFTPEQISSARLVMDSVASPPETRLIRLTHSLGVNAISGFEIVILQAVAQFALYTGRKPEPKQITLAADFARS